MKQPSIKELEVNAATLHKLLNHKLFLKNFPEIRGVDARQFGDGIDVTYFFADDVDFSKDYKEFGPKANQMVQDLARMVGVGRGDRINFYPLIPYKYR